MNKKLFYLFFCVQGVPQPDLMCSRIYVYGCIYVCKRGTEFALCFLNTPICGNGFNLASRLESSSEPNKVHVSIEVKESLEEIAGGAIGFHDRGLIEIKGKGNINTFFVMKKN